MKHLPTILIAGLLTGCAHFESKPLAPEKTAAQFAARRLDDTGLKKFLTQNLGHEPQSWPLADWDLKSLTLAAFYFHPDLEVARAQWRVAEASALTASPAIGLPNTGGRGDIQGGAIESSTVDIAQEFTNLIVLERGYQANSRVVTTADQLSQETINLIH